MHEAAQDDEALSRPLTLVRGGQIVGPASAPPLAELLAGTAAGTALASYADDLDTRHLLVGALNVITGLLALHDRLALEPLTTLATVYKPAAPGLLEHVHEAVAAHFAAKVDASEGTG